MKAQPSGHHRHQLNTTQQITSSLPNQSANFTHSTPRTMRRMRNQIIAAIFVLFLAAASFSLAQPHTCITGKGPYGIVIVGPAGYQLDRKVIGDHWRRTWEGSERLLRPYRQYASLSWRRTLQSFIPLVHPYQAPLLWCETNDRLNRLAGDLIPENYCVLMHGGTSFERHVRTVGSHSNSNMEKMNITIHSPENLYWHLGSWYCAEQVDDGTLDAIRADVAVDSVSCQRDPSIVEPDGSEEIIPVPCQSSLTRLMPAPLERCENPDAPPGSYCVFVHGDGSCTIESHVETVKSYFKDTDHVFPETVIHDGRYCVSAIDEVVLVAIRSDLAVWTIECAGATDLVPLPTDEATKRVSE